MTDNPAELQASELLAALGTVQPPEPRVLENAREVLWSAVASEMLGTGPAGEQTAAAPASGRRQHRSPTTRQRQAGRSPGERQEPV
jgi:hypothetical protein